MLESPTRTYLIAIDVTSHPIKKRRVTCPFPTDDELAEALLTSFGCRSPHGVVEGNGHTTGLRLKAHYHFSTVHIVSRKED